MERHPGASLPTKMVPKNQELHLIHESDKCWHRSFSLFFIPPLPKTQEDLSSGTMDFLSLVLCLKKKNLIYSKLILDFLEVFFSSLKMRYNGCWNSQESGPIMPCFIKLLIIFFPVIFAKIQTVEGRVGREATSFISGDFPLTFPFPMELQRVSHCTQGRSHGGKRPLFYIFLLSMKLSAG